MSPGDAIFNRYRSGRRDWLPIGALVFILFVPTQYAIQLQLLGGIWIIQTLPAVVLGAFTRGFDDWALPLGWAVGTVAGTAMAASVGFTPTCARRLRA